MKKYIYQIIFFCLFFSSGLAQSLAGFTNERDTSFTTYSAWLSAKKKYPQIEIVEQIKSSSIAENKNIIYKNVGDRKLLLDIFSLKRKPKKKQIPIMIIHGGGWRSGDRTQHFPLAQSLALHNYVCITVEYRLSTEALYPAAVYDINDALKWVKKNAGTYNIDTSKITILGFSAGGELAAYIGTTNNNPADAVHNGLEKNTIKSIIDIDGTLSFVHPESGEGDDSKKKSAATLWFGFSKKDNPDLWKQASPLTYASAFTPPTLFINSSVERMHAGREDYIKILNNNNIYAEVKTFENSPHTFCLFHPWFEPTVKYIDDFLKKVFKIKIKNSKG